MRDVLQRGYPLKRPDIDSSDMVAIEPPGAERTPPAPMSRAESIPPFPEAPAWGVPDRPSMPPPTSASSGGDYGAPSAPPWSPPQAAVPPPESQSSEAPSWIEPAFQSMAKTIADAISGAMPTSEKLREPVEDVRTYNPFLR